MARMFESFRCLMVYCHLGYFDVCIKTEIELNCVQRLLCWPMIQLTGAFLLTTILSLEVALYFRFAQLL